MVIIGGNNNLLFSRNGHLRVVKYMVEDMKANVDAIVDGKTPLHLACWSVAIYVENFYFCMYIHVCKYFFRMAVLIVWFLAPLCVQVLCTYNKHPLKKEDYTLSWIEF